MCSRWIQVRTVQAGGRSLNWYPLFRTKNRKTTLCLLSHSQRLGSSHTYLVPGYVVSRSDRGARVVGGVLLYSHVNIPASECHTFDDGVCEGIFCRFDTIKTCFAVVYRPPNAPVISFTALMQFVLSPQTVYLNYSRPIRATSGSKLTPHSFSHQGTLKTSVVSYYTSFLPISHSSTSPSATGRSSW
jgi:hypothetical protein